MQTALSYMWHTHIHTFQGVWRKRTCTHTASKHLRSSLHICGLSPGNKILIVSVFYWAMQVRTGSFFPIHKKRMTFSSLTLFLSILKGQNICFEQTKNCCIILKSEVCTFLCTFFNVNKSHLYVVLAKNVNTVALSKTFSKHYSVCLHSNIGSTNLVVWGGAICLFWPITDALFKKKKSKVEKTQLMEQMLHQLKLKLVCSFIKHNKLHKLKNNYFFYLWI